jgi:hypothetical protein
MTFHTTPYRLAVLIGIIVVAWLLVLIDVLPADVAVSVNLFVILCTLAPASKRRRSSQHRHD